MRFLPTLFHFAVLFFVFSSFARAKEAPLLANEYIEFSEVSTLPSFLEPDAENRKWLEQDASKNFLLTLSGKAQKDCTVRFEGKEQAYKKGEAYTLKIPLSFKSFEHKITITEGRETNEYHFNTFWKKLPSSIRIWIREKDGKISYASTGPKDRISPSAFSQLYINNTAVKSASKEEVESVKAEIKFFISMDEKTQIEQWVFRIKDAENHTVYEVKKESSDTSSLLLNFSELGMSKPGLYSYQLDFSLEKKEYLGTPNQIEILDKPVVSQKNSIRASLGVTSIQFKQTGFEDASSLATTAKVAYSRPLWAKYHLDIGGNLFMNVLTLSSTPENISVRFFGANLRVGYLFPQLSDPWSAGVHLGVYYTTMFVSNSSFGFRNLLFTQIFPTIRRKLNSHYSVGAYIKFAPLSPNLNMDFSEREIGAGLQLQRLFENKHPLFLDLDVSDLKVKSSRSQLQSQTFSLSIGYGF